MNSRMVWHEYMYLYGRFGSMKKTLHIDEQSLREAKAACGATTDTETVRLGLESLIRRAAYDRLRKLKGSEKVAQDVSRRRPEVAGER
jgi:Bacterial antitoxin of type II TA system, VapB